MGLHGRARRVGQSRRHAALSLVRCWAAFSLACALWFAGPACAQSQPVKLPTDATLARLIEQSLAARPELAQARAVAQARAQQVPQAETLPDPMLQLGIQNDGFSSIEIGRMETSFVSFMAAQTVPWPGKLPLRAELAALAATQSGHGITRVRLSTEADVRRAYLDLLLARDRLELLEQLAGVWNKSLDVARIRYEAGQGAQSDVLRAQLECNRLKQRRLLLLAEVDGRVQALNRLRGHPLDEAIETSLHIRELPALAAFESLFSARAALERSPELAAAQLGITRAGKSIALAERSSAPDLTVSAGVMVRGRLPPMWLLTLGAPLPVFSGSKQRHAVAENRAWQNAARQTAASIEQLLRLRHAERRTAFTTLLQTIDLYQQGLLIQSEATLQSTLSQYLVGNVTFVSVMEANSGFISDQENHLQSLAAAHRVLIAEAEASLSEVPMPTTAGVGSTMLPLGDAAPSGTQSSM